MTTGTVILRFREGRRYVPGTNLPLVSRIYPASIGMSSRREENVKNGAEVEVEGLRRARSPAVPVDSPPFSPHRK